MAKPKLTPDVLAIHKAVMMFHDKYCDMEGTLADWIGAANEMNDISNHFNNDPFAMGMLTAVYEELERKVKPIEPS